MIDVIILGIGNGFRIINSGTYFIKSFPSKQLEKIVSEEIIEKNVIEALGSMIEYLPDMGCEMYANIKINV